MQKNDVSQKAWWSAYLGHLASLAGGSAGSTGRADLGGLAELRDSARGGMFEIKALRHIVPYLSEPDARDFDRRVKVALLVGQIFSVLRFAVSADVSDEHPQSSKRPDTIGRKLGFLDAKRLSKSDSAGAEKTSVRTPTATERFFHTLVATEFDQIGSRLRNAVARINQAGMGFDYGDYRQLVQDLYWWDETEHRVQYRWVEEFYHARYRGEHDATKEREDNDEE